MGLVAMSQMTPEEKSRYYKKVWQFIEEGIPFNKVLGLKMALLEEGVAEMHLPLRPELIGNPLKPALHGGVISALADTCGGACLWTNLNVGDMLSTVDLRVDYFLPGPTKGILVARGVTRRMGNRVGVANIVLYPLDKPDQHIAEATGVYNVHRKQREKSS